MRRYWLIAITVVMCWTPFAFAELPEGLRFDDGFAWFECKNFDAVENNVAIGRWVLQSNVRIFGKVPDHSGWKLIVKQEDKPLAEYVTDGLPVKLGEAVGMNIVGFYKDKPKIEAAGLMDVEVYYIDGQSNKEHLARTCKLDVCKADKVRGGVKSREPGAASFYVNRHAEVLSTLLYFRDSGFPSYTQGNRMEIYSDRMVELIFNYSENEKFEGPGQGRIQVEVDGKIIEMKVPNNDKPQDEMGFGEEAGKYNVMHSDRNAQKYFEAGPPYQERIGFCRRSMILPLQWGPKPTNRPPSNLFTTDHPGEWKVTYLIERKPVRRFSFKIGANGLPEPHPEQTKGLSLAPSAVLIDTEIPKEGGEFDGRLTSEFVKAGAFFGRPWATDAMKKLAASVPTKGDPFPVTSDKR